MTQSAFSEQLAPPHGIARNYTLDKCHSRLFSRLHPPRRIFPLILPYIPVSALQA